MKAQYKPKFKVYGINDDTDTCEVCGKTNLKKVVWLMPLDAEGNEVAASPMPVGCDCAGRMMGWSFSRQKTESKLQEMLTETKKAAVGKAIMAITESPDWGVFASMFFPKAMITAIAKGEITKQQAYEERNARWPLLNYNNGSLSLDDAYAMISA